MSDQQHTIIIVRRRRGHGAGHHGGAWKIAFADFMTAMMAFFLVLWIVNSTSKETRSSIARYFNPIKLSETSPSRRGVESPSEPQAEDAKEEDAKGKLPPPTAAGRPGDANAAPMTVVTHASPATNPESKPDENVIVLQEAPAPRPRVDPFALAEPGLPRVVRSVPEPVAEPAPSAATTTQGETSAARAQVAQPSGEQQNAASLAQRVEETLRQAVGGITLPQVTVSRVDEGVLISLTDTLGFSMFETGSADPSTRSVQAVEKVGQALRSIEGRIIIRGHTDARPFRSRNGDNWRLASARAHTAQDILLRAGLTPQRIERVESHADQHLRNAQDPAAAENRRIEILVRLSGVAP